MAIGKGSASTEGFERKLYEGIASCKILAVNPTAKEIEKYRGFLPKEEPVYLTETEVDGKTVKQLRLEFLLQINPEKYVDSKGEMINVVIPMSMFLRYMKRVGRNSGKTQIMDNYARTAWATEAELASHSIPQNSDGPARIDSNYHIVADGEAELCNLLQSLINIKSVEKWEKDAEGKNIYKGLKDNPSDYECYINDVQKLFTGNISEIKEDLSLFPDNEVKVLFYVRKTDDGKLYQGVYTSEFIKNYVKDYASFSKKVLDSQNAGSNPNVEFYFNELREYSVKPTEFKENTSIEFPEVGTAPAKLPWE